MYLWFRLSARPSPAHCIWETWSARPSPPLLACSLYVQNFLSHLTGTRGQTHRKSGWHSGYLFSRLLLSPGPFRGTAEYLQSLWTHKENFPPTSFSAYFEKVGGENECAIIISYPDLEPYPSCFCFLSSSWSPDSLAGAGRRPTWHAQPPPPKSNGTEQSRLRSWVCHENSKLLLSAQNALAHMDALTVFSANKLPGAL